MRRWIGLGAVVASLAPVMVGCSGAEGVDTPTAAPATTATAGTSSIAAVATTVPPPPPAALGTAFDVTAYGAVADGRSDSTDAFQAAVDDAAAEGGTVLVPPGDASGGYVLNGTVTVPSGVAIIGSPAGTSIDPVGPFTWPGTDVPGVKLLVRPVDADQPAFRLGSGTTVRGLWISYDQQPLPSDAELSAIDGDYAFRSFDNARAFFVDEHVTVMAPTFVIEEGDNVTIADLVADRYYDFLYLAGGGPLHVDNVTLYGYNKGFVVEDSDRRNVFTDIHFRPGVGPIVPGPDEADRWSWVFGAIASRPDNLGFHLAASEGFVLDGVSFEGVHTAIRVGSSFDIPVVRPDDGEVFVSPSGEGAWGQISNVAMADVAVGFHLVGPSTSPIQMSNVAVSLGIDDGTDFTAISGTGDTAAVASQAMFLVEPTYATENNGEFAQPPGILATNLSVSGDSSPGRFAGAARTAGEINGRMFLVDGDLGMQILGFAVGPPYDESTTIAAGEGAGEAVIHIRAYLASGRPEADKIVDPSGVEILTPDVLIVERPVIVPPPATTTTTEAPDEPTGTTSPDG
jgi:Pectate lyase superfamily protein